MLHTRVSEQLSKDIRQFAEDLRVPASNLVRNVLEEVFSVVDGVGDDFGDLFEDLLEEAEGVRDRVRNQTRSPFRPRSHRGSRRSDVDAEVEKELRRDEASDPDSRSPASPGVSAPESEVPREPAARAAAGVETASATELFPEVLGWQPLVLNRDFACGRCQRTLSAGESAFLGLGAAGLSEIALCGRCAGQR